jgi:hypothetical protein
MKSFIEVSGNSRFITITTEEVRARYREMLNKQREAKEMISLKRRLFLRKWSLKRSGVFSSVRKGRLYFPKAKRIVGLDANLSGESIFGPAMDVTIRYLVTLKEMFRSFKQKK